MVQIEDQKKAGLRLYSNAMDESFLLKKATVVKTNGVNLIELIF